MNSKGYFMALALLPAILSTGCSAAQINRERSLTSARTEPQMYVFESDSSGFNTKNFFYDNGEEVVAFDTQFTADIAKKSIDFLRTKTQNPITYVVVTHPNPDKFNGMNVFQSEGAKVVASRTTAESMQGVHDYKKYYFVNIAKMFTEDTYPQLARADILFDRNYEIRLQNGEVIELSELTAPGVSSNQTVAYIASQNALLVGDLVHHKAHAWLEGGIVDGKPTPSLRTWITGLNEISARFASKNPVVYGGRGEAVRLDAAVPAQISYLKRADSMVNAYVKSLGGRKIELQSDKAGQHYATLQRKFEEAFPEYTLSYMIQYGVYGLVNSFSNREENRG